MSETTKEIPLWVGESQGNGAVRSLERACGRTRTDWREDRMLLLDPSRHPLLP